ncbi:MULTISPECIES: histidinol-phosphatase [unclassified Aureimonas]|uniref:histidinol-phosphatase n=1 Tax=unclassified Aureimonas TaxID=2615206 RepID=UPI0006FBA7DF|nr:MULTISPECIES: histidinol-phosphatase [unclassified Aureimonas]KQT52107.1 inositol monophosphatase [Aureimonas sp. Leaf427]KQT70660.1 inositol monophosphatase [Aureimonas sp. Leaf460]
MKALPDKDFLFGLADAADAQSLPRFRMNGAIDNKIEGDFDPVTEADRACEQAIRALIEARYPDHSILGEEFGTSGDSALQWVIDPIDGTRAFISGVPLWGTLVGLTVDGIARVGIMSQPYIGERFWADGGASWCEGPAGLRQLAVRRTEELASATVFTTSPHLFSADARGRFEALESACRLTRYGTDCYAFAMLAAGQIDLVVEPGLKPYDIVALIPIVEQAGGVISTFGGGRAEGGGDIIAAATPALHAAAMKAMAG